ncbi:MAG: hypothetical protein IT355_16890 [Gemmatimonadaceae bacterium]|nr:hypothetical protein [Gemmatimonadaceae bacterium]
MRRLAAVVLLASLTACGGDSTPLPPISVGPEWFPMMLDTTGNFVMRRLGMWIDTAHVTTQPSGYLLTSQKMLMDMKLGGVSTSMRLKTEIDCSGRRYRVIGMDSLVASVKGKPMSEADAQQAMKGQAANTVDTVWRAIPPTDKGSNAMLAVICTRTAPGAAPVAVPDAAPQ